MESGQHRRDRKSSPHPKQTHLHRLAPVHTPRGPAQSPHGPLKQPVSPSPRFTAQPAARGPQVPPTGTDCSGGEATEAGREAHSALRPAARAGPMHGRCSCRMSLSLGTAGHLAVLEMTRGLRGQRLPGTAGGQRWTATASRGGEAATPGARGPTALPPGGPPGVVFTQLHHPYRLVCLRSANYVRTPSPVLHVPQIY